MFRAATVLILMLLMPTQGLRAHGAYHDVVEEITRKLAVTPDDAALHFKLASAHEEHGEWKAALIECEKVKRLAATGFDTDFVEGKALACGGHLEAAKQVLESFLARQPHHAAARVERARVLWKQKKPEEAEKDFEAALSLESSAPVEWWIEAAEAGKAVETLRRALSQRGDDPQLLTASLEAELKAGDIDAALQRVETMRKIAPRPEPWMARRAEILTNAQRPVEARTAWQGLHQHLMALPNLERGIPLLSGLLAQCQHALGDASPPPVIAPPKP